jgi:hypothetical protein
MFRFTIREVLWLFVVLALGLALWIERSRNIVVRNQLRGIVDALKSVDVQAEVATDHVTITGPKFATHWLLGKRDPKRPPVVLDGTRVTPSIQPSP